MLITILVSSKKQFTNEGETQIENHKRINYFVNLFMIGFLLLLVLYKAKTN